jgi:hypothetical protein
MNVRPVLSKADMVRRYQANEFGNRSPTWDTPEEYCDHHHRNHSFMVNDTVHLRNRVAGGDTFYNLDGWSAYRRWITQSQPQNWYLSLMAPHQYNLLQGEVQRGPWGLYLHGSFEKDLPMRDALAKSSYNWQGLSAGILLQQVMNDLSWEWFNYLLEAYDDPPHVIEFSAFSKCWGTVPGHNVVIWEVRSGY